MRAQGKKVDQISDININSADAFKEASETDLYMRAANPIEYNFFSQDTTHLKNNGLCVADTILGVYSSLIKKLDMDYLIQLCYKVRGEQPPVNKKYSSLLDDGINDDDDFKDNRGWTIEQGITPEMVNKICIELNISHYAFDVTKHCFLKHISTSRNYPALIYYAINNHMYYLSDKNLCLKLIRQSQTMTTKIRSMILDDEHEAKIYLRVERYTRIYE